MSAIGIAAPAGGIVASVGIAMPDSIGTAGGGGGAVLHAASAAAATPTKSAEDSLQRSIIGLLPEPEQKFNDAGERAEFLRVPWARPV
jgi:hypothetical protein